MLSVKSMLIVILRIYHVQCLLKRKPELEELYRQISDPSWHWAQTLEPIELLNFCNDYVNFSHAKATPIFSGIGSFDFVYPGVDPKNPKKAVFIWCTYVSEKQETGICQMVQSVNENCIYECFTYYEEKDIHIYNEKCNFFNDLLAETKGRNSLPQAVDYNPQSPHLRPSKKPVSNSNNRQSKQADHNHSPAVDNVKHKLPTNSMNNNSKGSQINHNDTPTLGMPILHSVSRQGSQTNHNHSSMVENVENQLPQQPVHHYLQDSLEIHNRSSSAESGYYQQIPQSFGLNSLYSRQSYNRSSSMESDYYQQTPQSLGLTSQNSREDYNHFLSVKNVPHHQSQKSVGNVLSGDGSSHRHTSSMEKGQDRSPLQSLVHRLQAPNQMSSHNSLDKVQRHKLPCKTASMGPLNYSSSMNNMNYKAAEQHFDNTNLNVNTNIKQASQNHPSSVNYSHPVRNSNILQPQTYSIQGQPQMFPPNIQYIQMPDTGQPLQIAPPFISHVPQITPQGAINYIPQVPLPLGIANPLVFPQGTVFVSQVSPQGTVHFSHIPSQQSSGVYISYTPQQDAGNGFQIPAQSTIYVIQQPQVQGNVSQISRQNTAYATHEPQRSDNLYRTYSDRAAYVNSTLHLVKGNDSQIPQSGATYVPYPYQQYQGSIPQPSQSGMIYVTNENPQNEGNITQIHQGSVPQTQPAMVYTTNEIPQNQGNVPQMPEPRAAYLTQPNPAAQGPVFQTHQPEPVYMVHPNPQG